MLVDTTTKRSDKYKRYQFSSDATEMVSLEQITM